MQVLTICPSANGFELYSSCSSSVRWGHRRRRLGVSGTASNGVLYLSSNLRGFRSGAGFVGRSCRLDWRFLNLYPESITNPLFKLKKCPLSVALTLELQLEKPTVIENFGKEEFDHLSSKNINEVDNDGNVDELKGGIGNRENVQNGNNSRINVRALAWELHLAKTADDVEEVLKGKGEFPLQVYSTIIRGFGKDKKVDSTIALFEWLKRKRYESDSSIRLNLFMYNNLLGALRHAGNFDFVDEVLKDMAIERVQPNIVTYNTLMGVYIEQGQEVNALKLFEEMPMKGFIPSPSSYSTVLFAYRRMGDGFRALAFFVDIRNKYQKGEIGKDDNQDWEYEFKKLENFTIRICYHVMRTWLVRNDHNLSFEVLRLLKEIDVAGILLRCEDNERLIWACTSEKHYIVAKELYTRIREKGTTISLKVCNHVIWVMGKARKWWAALEIYEDLLDKGPNPNNISYELIASHFNLLLSAARKKGIWRWGVRLLNKMVEKGLKPGSREWNSVLVACSKASETSAAVEMFKRMVENGEKPTIISYGALLSALEKCKQYDEALKVWEHMGKMGIEPNLYAYTIIASIYSAQGKFDLLDSIIQEMVRVKVGPTVVTFNAIISGCAKNNRGSDAFEWFNRMKSLDIVPNEVTYEMSIEAFVNDSKSMLAYELYLRALNEGLVLSAKAYDAIVQSSKMYGSLLNISSLGPRPLEKKKILKIRKNLREFCSLADVPRRNKVFDRKEISYKEVHR